MSRKSTNAVPTYPDAARVCAELCISDVTLDALVRRGELPPHKKILGNKRVWKWTEIVRAIEGDADEAPNSPFRSEGEKIREATRQATGG